MKGRNNGDIICRRCASFAGVFYQVQASISAHGRVTLLSPDVVAGRGKDVAEFRDQGVLDPSRASAHGFRAAEDVFSTLQRFTADMGEANRGNDRSLTKLGRGQGDTKRQTHVDAEYLVRELEKKLRRCTKEGRPRPPTRAHVESRGVPGGGRHNPGKPINRRGRTVHGRQGFRGRVGGGVQKKDSLG